MTASKEDLWNRFQRYYTEFPTIGLAIDLSRMNFDGNFLASMETRIQRAFVAMDELEKGGIANPEERRMVGHYWLRSPALAPTQSIRQEIENTLEAIKIFAAKVHDGTIRGTEGPFENLLVIGIGGSALGPQFVADALGQPGKDKLAIYFFDNTDADGIDRVLAEIAPTLGRTLCLVISKSGGTKETRNGMLEAETAYQLKGLSFGQHAVAITGLGSELDGYSVRHNWLQRFPMWDWVGGRTSELSAVGLLPSALQGFDIDELISGARECDKLTRRPDVEVNPAALLALMWFYIGNGKGDKNMVILPYKDRLELFSRYLQQLVMESLGKELDLDGNKVNQGISVFGNKGSTDQHSYVQQLRDGINNFFVTFIEVLSDRVLASIMVEEKVTSGDYLFSFLQGTRNALYEKGRESITLTVRKLSPFTIGVLIALFERAVGFYATLINVNAYNQPGVEAGKQAATSLIRLQSDVVSFLSSNRRKEFTISQIADSLGDYESVFKICEHLAANPDRGLIKTPGGTVFSATYQLV